MTKHLLDFIFIAIIFGNNLLSQQAYPQSRNIYSPNKTFHVNITGRYYEGFVGDQKISLINNNEDTLWIKDVPRRHLVYPIVSDSGDVAIVHRKIEIYSKDNSLKGTYVFNNRESASFDEVDYVNAIQAFSSQPDRFFIFLTGDKNPSVNLVCFTDSVIKLWSTNLGNFKANHMFVNGDKIILDDCGYAGSRYVNKCYVFNINGDKLWQYETDSRTGRDWNVELDSSRNILIVNDKGKEFQVDLNNLNVE